MAKYASYPTYADTGNEWLPPLPNHWDVQRNKAMFSLIKKPVGSRSSDYQLLSLTLTGIIPRDLENLKGKMPAEFDTYQEVKRNDLVFCLFDVDETPRTIGLSQLEGMVTGAYSVYRCLPKAWPDYVYYYYFHLDQFKGLRPFYTGLRKVVRPETFSNIKMPAPPVEEQKTIAAFLDHETAKIDRLIAKQERLIELLKEKRQAVISHAVTKGLNPDAPMKDSGVEWLGEVPAHWSVCDVKHVTSFITSGPRGWSDYISDQGDIFLQSGDLAGDLTIKWENAKKVVPTEGAEGIRTSLKKGDVLVCITGANTGNVGLVETIPGKAFINQHLAIVRSARAKTLPKYLAQCLISRVGQKHFSQVQYGLKEGLSLENVREAVVTLPPMNEQMKISQFIEAKRQKLDILHQKSFRSVELMKEHRTALISAAVTGKIDVRGWQKPNIEPEQTATAVSA